MDVELPVVIKVIKELVGVLDLHMTPKLAQTGHENGASLSESVQSFFSFILMIIAPFTMYMGASWERYYRVR